ncbi:MULTISPECIES: lytic transglycosylase domain-containing protein [Nocardia]|uniref:Transglycosylase protein with SLT domain n=2 Tax=Nocardia TaxID=1817 RepID=A0A4R6PY39_NOCIG|nr:transglycosylase protein with SLT domain [Nocardia ignorata]
MQKAGVIVAVAVAALLTGCSSLASIPGDMPPGPGVALPVIDIDAPGRAATQLRGWADEQSDALGIAPVALEAYGYAAAVLARSAPECGIAWTTIAGIASVESGHGTHRGADVDADGTVRPPIIGVALDGTKGNAVIRDTDGGRLDGDTTYDRAVGPLQFIPETWQRWAVDANGDGVLDPQNIDDAALTAARYLCTRGGNLTSADGWQRALFAYNQSNKYMLVVRDRAAAYSIGRRA